MLFAMRSNLDANTAYTYWDGTALLVTIVGDSNTLWQWMADCDFSREFAYQLMQDVEADDWVGYSYSHPDGRWVEVYPLVMLDEDTEATIEAAFAPEPEQLTLAEAYAQWLDDCEDTFAPVAAQLLPKKGWLRRWAAYVL